MSPHPHRLFDLSAISLSGLCLAHCLALPVLAAFVPALAAWTRAEWVHGLIVLVAAPLTAFALWRAHLARPLPMALLALAALSLLALTAGALQWPQARWATPITVAGSLLLASAHGWNWRRLAHAHG
jgi:hypothetical protein